MQATQDISFVYILHNDLLWRIFQENIEFPRGVVYDQLLKTSPLITARHCSQVCRRWRDIYLQSPSIWAKVMDLGKLCQKQDDWRKEVVSRSGQALIWVYGIPNTRASDFFMPFLKDNWTRVQRIAFNDVQRWPGEDRRNMWAFLTEPAPNLHSILLARWDSMPSGALFSDHAPLLRRFDISMWGYSVPANSSWLPNLTHVTIHERHKIKEVMQALKQMRQLIFLDIATNYAYSPSRLEELQSNGTITLPGLEMLFLRGHFSNVASMLEIIALSCESRLYITGPPVVDHLLWEPAPSSEEYERYETSVIKQIIPYFAAHPPRRAFLRLFRNRMSLESDPASNYLEWRLPFYVPFLSPSLLVVKALARSASLSLVHELQTWPMFREATLAVTSILTLFPSLKTLHVLTERVLELLLQHDSIGTDTDTIFPLLTTLKVEWPSKEGVSADKDPAHHRFLRHRRAIGKPISVFEPIPWKATYPPLPDMDYLEEHTGLLVRWTTAEGMREYRCGDGRPEELRFQTFGLK